VEENECGKWKDVSLAMMSDEDECYGKFKVIRPKGRSIKFNTLMEVHRIQHLEELDAQAIQRNPKRPRYDRLLGLLIEVAAQTKVKEWMLAGNEHLNMNSPDLI